MDNPTKLRSALALAARLNIAVSKPRRTGEVLFAHPVYGRVRHNGRRQDLSRAARVLFKRAIAAKEVA